MFAPEVTLISNVPNDFEGPCRLERHACAILLHPLPHKARAPQFKIKTTIRFRLIDLQSKFQNNCNTCAVLENRNVAGSRFELLISGFLKATELL